MGIIDLKYDNLFDNYTSVTTNIDNLMNIINDLNSNIQSLSGSWEGTLSSAFASFSSNFDVFSKQIILNFKNTEEYKKYAIKSFKLNEQDNLSKYNI